MLKFDRQSFNSRVIAILDLTSSSLTLLTKKCLVLYCAVEMKATNEKKGIFSFYSHNVDKKIQWEPFPLQWT